MSDGLEDALDELEDALSTLKRVQHHFDWRTPHRSAYDEDDWHELLGAYDEVVKAARAVIAGAAEAA